MSWHTRPDGDARSVGRTWFLPNGDHLCGLRVDEFNATGRWRYHRWRLVGRGADGEGHATVWLRVPGGVLVHGLPGIRYPEVAAQHAEFLEDERREEATVGKGVAELVLLIAVPTLATVVWLVYRSKSPQRRLDRQENDELLAARGALGDIRRLVRSARNTFGAEGNFVGNALIDSIDDTITEFYEKRGTT